MEETRKICVDDAARVLEQLWSQQVVGRANGSLFKVAKGAQDA